MNSRAEVSEQDIAVGKVKSFDQFNISFENWKIQKRAAYNGQKTINNGRARIK